MAKQRSIPEASIDTKLVYQRIKTIDQGGIIAYTELQEILGRDPTRGKGYSSVASARRMALNIDGIVFAAVAGVGLKRLTDSELARVGVQTLTHIRRTARNGAKKVTSIRDFDGLTREEKIAHNTSLSMLGAIQQAASTKTAGRIEKAVEKASQALPVAATLKLFGD